MAGTALAVADECTNRLDFFCTDAIAEVHKEYPKFPVGCSLLALRKIHG